MVPVASDPEHDIAAHHGMTETTSIGDSVRADEHESPSSAEWLPVERPPWWSGIRPYHAFYVLAAIPPLWMLTHIASASRLQWFDYWELLPRFVNPDGSLAVRNLLEQHQGHVLGVPRVVYWINLQLFEGSNRTLGVYVVGIVVAQIVLISVLWPRRLPPAWRAGLTAFASVMLLAPQGMHNFTRAMSGSAWLTANLFALLAIAAARSNRVVLAIALALLATVSYGTGLVAWAAIFVVFLVSDRRSLRRLAVVAVSALLVTLWYAAGYEGASGQSSPSLEPNDVLRRTLQVLGATLIPDAEIAVVMGAAGMMLFVGFALAASRTDPQSAAPFIGLGSYAIGGALLIGGARGGIHSEDIGITSRYASLSSLLWIAVAVLAARCFPRLVTSVAVASVGMIAFVGGQTALAESKAINQFQNELAIAIRMEVASDWTYYFDELVPSGFLRSIGQYPMTDGFTADCGRLGTRLRPDEIGAEQQQGLLDGFTRTINNESVRVSGWVAPSDGSVRCILIVDDSDRVVGAAAYGGERLDVARANTEKGVPIDSGFNGVVELGDPDATYRTFAVLDTSDALWPIPGTLRAANAPSVGNS